MLLLNGERRCSAIGVLSLKTRGSVGRFNLFLRRVSCATGPSCRILRVIPSTYVACRPLNRPGLLVCSVRKHTTNNLTSNTHRRRALNLPLSLCSTPPFLHPLARSIFLC